MNFTAESLPIVIGIVLLQTTLCAIVGWSYRGNAIIGGGFGFLAGVAGFALGPIAWIVLAVLGWSAIFAVPDQRTLCKACRSRIVDDATKCRHCGDAQ